MRSFGAEDRPIPVDTVRQFEAALDTNGTPNEIHVYQCFRHAFANYSGTNHTAAESADA